MRRILASLAVAVLGVLIAAQAVAAADPPAAAPPSDLTAGIQPGTIAVGPDGITAAQTKPSAGPHVMKTSNDPGAASAAVAGNPGPMTYHGGAIQRVPKVITVFWGTAFNTGFNAFGVTSGQYINYINFLYGHFGGMDYIGSQNQYCQGVPSGTINCFGSGTHITNPSAQLVGSWIILDNNPPTSPSQGDIANAADVGRRAQYGTFGNDSDADFQVFTLPDHNTPGFGSTFCAWHSWYFSFASLSNVHYSNMPFIPQAGGGCGRNILNANDSFGHGSLDGVFLVGMHEQAEVITDPNTGDGWFDTNTAGENGDKCAWFNITNIKVGTTYAAAQPLWSNLNNGCVFNQFPGITVSPPSADYGGVLVGSTSASTTWTVTNNGQLDMFPGAAFLAGSEPSQFVLSFNNCTGTRVRPGVSCFLATFARPTSIGFHSATLNLNSDAGNVSMGLFVTGLQPRAALTPAALAYGNQLVGSQSASQTLTLSNTGNSPMSVTGAVPGSGFVITGGSCPATPFSLAAGGACTWNIAFAPSAVKAYATTFDVTDNAPGSPHRSTLTGNGTDMVQISPGALNFGNQRVGTTSGDLTTTVTNAGTSAFTITNVALAGANPADYSETDTCFGATLNPADNCTITVNFTPIDVGSRPASIQIDTDALTGTHFVALSGNGIFPAVTLRPSSIQFLDTPVGSTTADATVTVVNSGTDTLNISSVALGGAVPGDYTISVDNCSGTSLAPGTSCTVSVNATPSDFGDRSAEIDITSDALSSPDVVPLDVNGI